MSRASGCGGNRVCIAIPPLTFHYYRFRATTLATLAWYVAEAQAGDCEIEWSYDANKRLEYIAIECSSELSKECSPDLDTLLAYVFKAGTGQNRKLTKFFYDAIKMDYDNVKEKLIIGGRSYPKPIYKRRQAALIIEPTRYTYGRGIAVQVVSSEIVKEIVKGSKPQLQPQPQTGFIDVLFGDNDLRPVLFVMAPWGQSYLGGRVISLGNERVNIETLAANIGDGGVGLRDFIEFAYNVEWVHTECNDIVSEPKVFGLKEKLVPRIRRGAQREVRLDLHLVTKLNLMLRVIEEALRGEIEGVSGWPSLALITYDPSNAKLMSIEVLPPSSLASAIDALEESARLLGIPPSRLARGLRNLLECILLGGESSKVAGSAMEVIEAFLRGYADYDLLASIVRPLSSIKELSDPCKAFLSSIR